MLRFMEIYQILIKIKCFMNEPTTKQFSSSSAKHFLQLSEIAHFSTYKTKYFAVKIDRQIST